MSAFIRRFLRKRNALKNLLYIMKVVFLCGSLEPGYDGVGDYTRRLSGELIRQGHQASAIALHDNNLRQGIVETIQNDEIEEICTLRLSSKLTWKERIEKASSFIEKFDPDWISLQYVPYSFHDKGLPFGLSERLKNLSKGRKWHIMFHELWTGIEVEASRKKVWWGYIQKRLIKNMLISLNPRVIHTQSKIYHYMLSVLYPHTELLPLFGNIPVTLSASNLYKNRKNDFVSFVIFGGIHEKSLINEFALEASNYSRNKKVSFKFIFLGHNGKLLTNWVDAFSKEGFVVEVLGEQSVEKISEVLINSAFGITSTPLLLTDKSGTVASMIEHRSPVICIRNGWRVRHEFSQPNSQVIEYRVGDFESIIDSNRKKISPDNSLNKITYNLIKSFVKSGADQ